MDDDLCRDIKIEENLRIDSHYLGLIPVLVLMVIVFVRISFILCKSYGQKTRTRPPSRMYGGSRARQSLSQAEPTIYVSPNNFPPPPKYECLAPPSYEEVVGIHYPQYPSQPITQPITAAMTAQTSAANVTDPPAVVTITSEARTSVPVSSS